MRIRVPTGLGVSEACLGTELHSVPGLGCNDVIVKQARKSQCGPVSRVRSPVEEVDGRQCPIQGYRESTGKAQTQRKGRCGGEGQSTAQAA